MLTVSPWLNQSMTGHLLGAAAAVKRSTASLRCTARCRRPSTSSPATRSVISTTSRTARPAGRGGLSNSLGFGGRTQRLPLGALGSKGLGDGARYDQAERSPASDHAAVAFRHALIAHAQELGYHTIDHGLRPPTRSTISTRLRRWRRHHRRLIAPCCVWHGDRNEHGGEPL